MNVAVLLSGGNGKRFGAKLPKQYLNLCGKPVIEYAIDAVLNSKKIDEVVLVIDNEYLDFVKEKDNPRIHITNNGNERLNSVKNGLDYIKNNFNCENVIIVQAVSPFITSKIIDDYISLLDQYDVVTTAEKCTGELFNIKQYNKINRNDYYFCQSPEAFKFNELYKNLDLNSEYSELIYHYPNEPKIYYYLDFKNNVKLTYQSDLEYCKFLIKNKDDEKI
mgnify:CR=1 FL=1